MIKKPEKKENTKKIDSILKTVQKNIKPDMKVLTDADFIVDKINSLLKKSGIHAECVKGGSIAKGTFLKDDYDIDLFVRFNPSYEDDTISDLAEDVLKVLCKSLKVKFERVHGSRDYFQFDMQKGRKILSFEVIPVMLVHMENYHDARNITDLSPEHVEWVKKYTSKNPKIVDDIRLAKQFCKANKVYGAESYINGFSGHILDILVIHYGGFMNMLKAFSRLSDDDLKKPIIIDTEKNLVNPLKQLNKSKITPLIIVDPIQKDRNSAAALSKEKLLMFIDAAKKFIEKPDKKFFDIKEFDLEEEIKYALKSSKLKSSLKPSDVTIARIDIDTLDGSRDVVGTKVLKVFDAITEHSKEYGFNILGSGWNFIFDERRAVAFIICDNKISKDITQQGPPISSTANYNIFVDKHKKAGHKILAKDGRAYAIIPRKYLDIKSFITDFCKQEFISKRIKRIFVR